MMKTGNDLDLVRGDCIVSKKTVLIWG